MQSQSTIQHLIESRCRELNISFKQLIINTGYTNVSVGLKRLEQLFQNDYKLASGLIKKLPEALKIAPEDVQEAILCSQLAQRAAQDEFERLWFRPNFLVRTEQQGRPKQIFIAAILNANRNITAYFPADLKVKYYKRYAVEHFRLYYQEIIALFYEPIDIVINYSYEQAEVISLEGDHIEYLNKHVKAGKITYEI